MNAGKGSGILRLVPVFFLGVSVLLFLAASPPCHARAILFHWGDTEAPDPDQKPAVGDYWKAWDHSQGDPLILEQQPFVWIGSANDNAPNRHKSVTILLWGKNLTKLSNDPQDPATFLKPGATNNPPNPDIRTNQRKDPNYRGWFQLYDCELKPSEFRFQVIQQPDGEWLRLHGYGTGGEAVQIYKAKIITTCYDGDVNYGKNCKYKNGRSVDPPDTLQLTEFWYLPEEVDIDNLVVPTFEGPAGSGNWSYSWVTTDPYGNPMPHGGVKWVTDGAGITDDQPYSAEFSCKEEGNVWTRFYMYDENTEMYIDQDLYCPEPATMGLFGVGLAGVLWLRRRRRQGRP